MRSGLDKKLILTVVFSIFLACTTTVQSNTNSVILFSDETVVCDDDDKIPDSDFDFIPDIIETTADTDNDGIPNYLDTDSDNDGIPDVHEVGQYFEPWRTDGYMALRTGCESKHWGTYLLGGGSGVTIHSGLAWVDGIGYEFPFDVDQNGVADYLLDANANDVADYLEPAPAVYTMDTDPCIAKGGYTDTDRDLIADVIEGDADIDNDGLPNYRDSDSDGDGLSDYWERKWLQTKQNYDYDSDGIIAGVDVDDNDRTIVCIVDLVKPADLDLNGIYDYLETPTYVANNTCTAMGAGRDTDGDWIIDSLETDADTDGDGIPNYLDTDSDNDGISDRQEYMPQESSTERLDNDHDGVSHDNDVDDTDYNVACLSSEMPPLPDFRGDGIPDYLDADRDDDGLLDGDELSYAGIQTVDTDNDSLTDDYEITIGTNPGEQDSDGGGAHDDWEILQGSDPTDSADDSTLALDLDVDNDGIEDTLEQNIWRQINRDSDGDGRSDAQEAGLIDANNDGYVDDQTDSNNNGQPDAGESLTVLPDFDNDGVPDMLDQDSDNDSYPDRWEFNVTGLPDGYTINPNDVDGDGQLNLHDLDSDNDGIFDVVEGELGYIRYQLYDVFGLDTIRDINNDGLIDDMQDNDVDGIPDHVDATYITDEPDSDENGIIDRAQYDLIFPKTRTHGHGYEETIVSDQNLNNIADHLEPDIDNDGAFDHTLTRRPSIDADEDGISALFDTDDSVAFAPDTSTPNAIETPAVGAATNGNSGGGALSIWLLGLLAAFRIPGYPHLQTGQVICKFLSHSGVATTR